MQVQRRPDDMGRDARGRTGDIREGGRFEDG
jgi:hypothetical protein